MTKLFKIPMRLQFFADGDETTPPADESKSFTQEEVDQIVADRVDRAEKKSGKVATGLQAKLDEATAKLDNAGKSKEEQDNADLEALKGNLSAKEEELANTKAELEALKQGVPADKLEKVIKLAKLSDEEDIETAIAGVLEEFPMFKESKEDEKGPYFSKKGNKNKDDKETNAFELVAKKYKK
ncbi:hypothetical protein [Carnobacterium jeotgali]|uniref:hypothetical protein n=1 Tax=Carnobacterium jeotgali TaxID=545534 RepID=UPI0004939122|nr:hypothetical protein [Carnobacterium jeotgali]